jgi:transcriptional coactivator HFI1/ADA1
LENGVSGAPETKAENNDADEMDVDDDDDAAFSDWEGGTALDREQLNGLLDDCLSMAA